MKGNDVSWFVQALRVLCGESRVLSCKLHGLKERFS